MDFVKNNVKLIDLVGIIPFSGIPLIIAMFIVVVIMSILVPSVSTKWLLAYPTFVPLFMRSNITPDFTQFVFKAADGIGKGHRTVFNLRASCHAFHRQSSCRIYP